MVAIVLALGAKHLLGDLRLLGGLKSRSLPVLSVLLVSQASALALLVAWLLVSGAAPPETGFLLAGVTAISGA